MDKEISRIRINRAFELIMLILCIGWIVLWLIDPMGWQMSVFFAKAENFFADFFNVMIYVSDSDIYHNTINGTIQKIYFPLVYMFMSLFSGFEDYSVLTLQDCYNSPPAMLSCIFFVLSSIFLYLHAISKFVSINSKQIFIIVFSSVFLFTIERGNVIMISAACSFYFLSYKDSKNWRARIFSLLALCFAIVMKGYPAILGIYLLVEKRYKEITFCFVLTLFLVFVPFLWFDHGFANIPQFMDNVKHHNEIYINAFFPRYGIIAFTSILCEYGFINLIAYELSKYSMIVLAVISVFLFYKERMAWKQLALLCFILAYIPANNGFYCGIYFIPIIFVFLKTNEGRKMDYIYMLLFCVFLNPVQIVLKGYTISWMLSNFAMLMMWLLIIIDSSRLWRVTQKKEFVE